MDKLLYTISESCFILNVGKSFLYQNLISTGRIKTIKMGRKTLIAAESLRQFVSELKEK